MTLPVMLFTGGPAAGWMLSRDNQIYTVGLEQPEDGKALCALYYRYGASPGYAGVLPGYLQTGVFVYKTDKVRAVSLIDGWMPGVREGNTDGTPVVDV